MLKSADRSELIVCLSVYRVCVSNNVLHAFKLIRLIKEKIQSSNIEAIYIPYTPKLILPLPLFSVDEILRRGMQRRLSVWILNVKVIHSPCKCENQSKIGRLSLINIELKLFQDCQRLIGQTVIVYHAVHVILLVCRYGLADISYFDANAKPEYLAFLWEKGEKSPLP